MHKTQILVQILTGRKIYLTVESKHCTLLDVKKKIQAKEGIHPDQQILLWNGERLMDGSLKDLKIHEGAMFFLTLRNRGG
jgi:Ubiquitin family